MTPLEGGEISTNGVDMVGIGEPRTSSKWVRRLLSGFIDLILLQLLAEGPNTGYGLINLIRDRFGVLLGPGSVYPVLADLQRQGLIIGIANGRRTVYQLTPRGKMMVEGFHREWARLVQELLG